MRKIAGMMLLAAAVITSCKNNDQFTIDGKLENATGIKKVMLYQADQLIDSAFVNEKSEFRFKRVNPDPDFYTMAAGENRFQLIAQNGDEIDFKADLADTSGNYTLTGSETSEKVREFNKLSQKYGKIYKALQEQFERETTANPESKDSIYGVLMPEFQRNMDAFGKEAIAFGEKNKDNLAGFYAVGSIDQTTYEAELIKYAEEIKDKFPNNKPVQAFVTKMTALKPVSVGQPAPLFEIPGISGGQIKLSDFKGKYVLLDFWASWCAPCRQENPNVVNVYQQLKDKGFTVFGVSLDEDKAAWQKAVKDDNLTWSHASDLLGWQSKPAQLYKVEGIPSSFIIDPSGKIVAKNLRGPQLEAFLKERLK